MYAIQALLAGVFSSLLIVTVLIYLGQVLSEGVRIYDKTQMIKGRLQNGTIYDKDWRVRGFIDDRKVYDRDWSIRKRIENGKIYDRNWSLKGGLEMR